MTQNLAKLESLCIHKINQNKDTLNKTGYYSFILQVGDLFFDFDTSKKEFKVRQLIRNNGKVSGNDQANDFPLLRNNNIYAALSSLAETFDQKDAKKALFSKESALNDSVSNYLKLLN